MNEIKTQNQRLDYLVEEFKRDSVQYIDLETPKDTEGKRRILRSLMNIRMPGKMNEAVLAVQDDYLRERIRENGIVEPADIPVIWDQISTELRRGLRTGRNHRQIHLYQRRHPGDPDETVSIEDN